MTDFVTVQSAEIIEYAVAPTLTTFSGPDGAVVLEAARQRLDDYIKASHRIGRDITRSREFAALHVEGVQNVVLASPAAELIISRTQAPHCTGIVLTYAGTGVSYSIVLPPGSTQFEKALEQAAARVLDFPVPRMKSTQRNGSSLR